MTFSEQPPSQQWAALSYRGEKFAEAWLKPDGQPFALTFRIPPKSFETPHISPLLTIENLLKAVGIASEEVESWHPEDDSHSGLMNYHAELSLPLPSLPSNVSQLYLHIQMKQPAREMTPEESTKPETLSAKWLELVTRWHFIVGLEVTIDTMRQRMESLRSEVEVMSGKSLTTDEKLHALNLDVSQWTKAKSRARYALPKIKEFIHRAVWAMGTPERKQLEELFKHYSPPESLLSEIDKVQYELKSLLKDRQILSAQGVTCYQEGKSSCEDVQKTLRTLQTNANANAVKKRAATRAKNKSY